MYASWQLWRTPSVTNAAKKCKTWGFIFCLLNLILLVFWLMPPAKHDDSAQQLSTHWHALACTQHGSERDKGKGLWVMLGFTVQARSTASATAALPDDSVCGVEMADAIVEVNWARVEATRNRLLRWWSVGTTLVLVMVLVSVLVLLMVMSARSSVAQFNKR